MPPMGSAEPCLFYSKSSLIAVHRITAVERLDGKGKMMLKA